MMTTPKPTSPKPPSVCDYCGRRVPRYKVDEAKAMGGSALCAACAKSVK